MNKPSLFVGSSTEGLPFARAVRRCLDIDAEVTLWNEGFFAVGNTFIDTLVNSLGRFDFAVLVLTADDLIKSRNDEILGPRDNVLFELGLFMGRLGRSRTLALVQSNARVKLPTDLSGVTTAGYQWPREDGSHESAVGAACDDIRRVVSALGVSEAKTAKALSSLESTQKGQQSQLTRQEEQIRMLQVALKGIVSKYERDKLKGLAQAGSFHCWYSDKLYHEVERLRALDLLSTQEGKTLLQIKARYKDSPDQFDLKEYFYITPSGLEYLRLRDGVDTL